MEFTEADYNKILICAKSKYRFYLFTAYKTIETGVLWRHDIDFSVHRAAALAKIESEIGVQATYFVHFHNIFYNALEREIVELLRGIAEQGHAIGLHFEPGFYGLHTEDIEGLERCARDEKELLESLVGRPVQACSFHNPDVGGAWHLLELEEIAGMVSAYSPYIRENFAYCSDSNGYWRFDSLEAVLEKEPPRLHVLTHPAWWQADSMPPRDRVVRCAQGRAEKTMKDYDRLLEEMGRINVRS